MEKHMEISEFILSGLTNLRKLQHLFFPVFLMLYTASLLDSSAILVVVLSESRLHNPMYFFLGNLSCLDMFYSTVTVPKMLSDFLLQNQTISFAGCLAQLHFFHFLGSSEAILLAVMAYDHYVAICNPLHYMIVMNQRACLLLAQSTWATCFLHALMHSVMTSELSFCGPISVHHFFCDIKPLLNLACGSTQLSLILLNFVSGNIALLSFTITLLSYLYIISFLLLKVQFWESKRKSFSTCTSHLMVVCLFYMPVLDNYMLASPKVSSEGDMISTVMYGVVTPVLNLLIYTLRNQEVKCALKKFLKRRLFPEKK